MEQANGEGQMDAETKSTPESVMAKPAKVPGKNGGTLTPIRTTERSLELHRRRWGSHDLGVSIGLQQAAGEFEGQPDISVTRSAAVYGKEIGKGILAGAMDRPLDAARALRALRPPDMQQARNGPQVAVLVQLSPAQRAQVGVVEARYRDVEDAGE